MVAAFLHSGTETAVGMRGNRAAEENGDSRGCKKRQASLTAT